MKKIKEKAKKNVIKNSGPMNISIALNINSPLISHHHSQNLNDKYESKNGMKIEDASKQETIKKERRKVIFQQKLRNLQSCKDETDAVESIQALASIDQYSKTTLTNKIKEDKGMLSQMGARLDQARNCATNRQKISHRSWIQQNMEKKNHKLNFNTTDKSQILESHQFPKQLSSLKACKYKSEFKSKKSKNNLSLQRNVRSSTHYRNFSSNLETTSIRKMRHKSRKALDQKRQIFTSEQNLKEKLLKFRLDILKLQETYQQSEIYKSKASVVPRSPAFEFTNDPRDGSDESEALHQMMFFQRKYESQLSQRHFDKQDVVGDDQLNEQKKIGTLQLVQYYQTNHLQNQSEDQQKHFSLLSLVQPINVQQNHTEQRQEIAKKSYLKLDFNLQDFLAYMKKKNIDFSSANLQMLETHVKNFKQRHLNQSDSTNNNLKQKPIDNIISQDLEIDRQIQRIQKEKRRLARQLDLQDQNWTAIDDWSYKYRLDLIKLKRKMWGQYEVIKRFMKQSKINHQHKSHNLMKCLSEDYLSYQNSDEDKSVSDLSLQIQQISLKNTIDHEQHTLSRQQQQYLLTVHDEENSQNNSQIDDLQLLQSLNFHSQQAMPNDRSLVETASRLKSVTRAQKDEIKQLILSQLIQEFCKQFIEKRPSSVSKVIYHAKFLNKLKSVKKKGFQTGSNAVKAITQQLSKLFTMNKHIQDSPLSIRQEILQNLNKPCGPTTKEILRSLRYDPFINKPILSQNMNEIQQVEVLSVQIFHQFQINCIKIKELSFEKFYDDEERQQQRVLSLRNFVHIHHKAIFDCFNEAFDYQRIFGIWGKPFSWKLKPSFEKAIDQSLFPNIMEKCKKKVYDNCKFVCGLLLDKENSLIKSYQHQPQLIQQLREERAHKFLEDYNNQINERWFFVDDDEAEIMQELTHGIWRGLIDQIAKEIMTIATLKRK